MDVHWSVIIIWRQLWLLNYKIIYLYVAFVGLTQMGIYIVLITGMKRSVCMTYEEKRAVIT